MRNSFRLYCPLSFKLGFYFLLPTTVFRFLIVRDEKHLGVILDSMYKNKYSLSQTVLREILQLMIKMDRKFSEIKELMLKFKDSIND